MSFRPRVSLRTGLVIIAVCGIGAWLVRAWLYPNRMPGQHFALIGPMDIDRDGLDDRERLKWMIHRNGGTVDYDLPAAGHATGMIGARTTWYVIAGDRSRSGSSLPTVYRARASEVMRQARLAGTRPMPLERLVSYLSGERDAPNPAGVSGDRRP
jgi:hypothetical protein